MIRIVSPGRCGSAWLSTFLVALGLDGVHEWTPNKIPKHFASDTSWVWNIDQFIDNLGPETAIIVLDRPQQERDNSANALLNTTQNWDALEEQWKIAKERLKDVYNDILWLKYEDLFEYSGRSALWHFLDLDVSQERFFSVWEFMRHMNIQNRTAIREVKGSYGR